MANRALYIDPLLPVAERMAEMNRSTQRHSAGGRAVPGHVLGSGPVRSKREVTIDDRTADLREFRTRADHWESATLKFAKLMARDDPDWY